MTVWRLRAWDDVELQQAWLDRSIVAMSEDLVDVATRDEVKRRLHAAYPDRNERTIAVWAGYWVAFMALAPGDLVVVPLAHRRVAIGRVTGPHRYDPDEPTPACATPTPSPGGPPCTGTPCPPTSAGRSTLRAPSAASAPPTPPAVWPISPPSDVTEGPNGPYRREWLNCAHGAPMSTFVTRRSIAPTAAAVVALLALNLGALASGAVDTKPGPVRAAAPDARPAAETTTSTSTSTTSTTAAPTTTSTTAVPAPATTAVKRPAPAVPTTTTPTTVRGPMLSRTARTVPTGKWTCATQSSTTNSYWSWTCSGDTANGPGTWTCTDDRSMIKVDCSGATGGGDSSWGWKLRDGGGWEEVPVSAGSAASAGTWCGTNYDAGYHRCVRQAGPLADGGMSGGGAWSWRRRDGKFVGASAQNPGDSWECTLTGGPGDPTRFDCEGALFPTDIITPVPAWRSF